ncbi:MAG TPA: hypothetical protein VJH24_03785 [Candidatus Bilamarchaeaceae archaeon]|nr:hypothetical protein [Candidatus Bilamarchaeaceae archaeon]
MKLFLKGFGPVVEENFLVKSFQSKTGLLKGFDIGKTLPSHGKDSRFDPARAHIRDFYVHKSLFYVQKVTPIIRFPALVAGRFILRSCGGRHPHPEYELEKCREGGCQYEKGK